MGGISYVAHVSNGKSAITTKRKLEGVAKHNLRKYKSDEYSAENIMLLYGTENLVKDVKKVLMTRGVNGMYIYACDPELRAALLEAAK